MENYKIETLKKILDVLSKDETAYVALQVHNMSYDDFEEYDLELTQDDIEAILKHIDKED